LAGRKNTKYYRDRDRRLLIATKENGKKGNSEETKYLVFLPRQPNLG
jgi:hypothetical protein